MKRRPTLDFSNQIMSGKILSFGILMFKESYKKVDLSTTFKMSNYFKKFQKRKLENSNLRDQRSVYSETSICIE